MGSIIMMPSFAVPAVTASLFVGALFRVEANSISQCAQCNGGLLPRLSNVDLLALALWASSLEIPALRSSALDRFAVQADWLQMVSWPICDLRSFVRGGMQNLWIVRSTIHTGTQVVSSQI